MNVCGDYNIGIINLQPCSHNNGYQYLSEFALEYILVHNQGYFTDAILVI